MIFERSRIIPPATTNADVATKTGALNPPYGGPLVDLIVPDARAAEMKATAKDFASLTLDERGLCDLELLAVGGFSPLKGFLGKADYEGVVGEMRLADGTLWPLPVTLPVKPGDGIAEGKPLALRDVYGNLLAFLHVEEIYEYDKENEAAQLLRLAGRQASRGRPPQPPAEPLRRRSSRGHPRTAPLRFRRAPPHSVRAARSLQVAGMEQDRRIPDPQPSAPGA